MYIKKYNGLKKIHLGTTLKLYTQCFGPAHDTKTAVKQIVLLVH